MAGMTRLHIIRSRHDRIALAILPPPGEWRDEVLLIQDAVFRRDEKWPEGVGVFVGRDDAAARGLPLDGRALTNAAIVERIFAADKVLCW